jgi:RHS repeat-associated protein
VLPAGAVTVNEFDAFGSPRAVTEDAANSPVPQVTTDRNQGAFAAAGTPTSETVSRVINGAAVPVRRVVEVTYLDGWGRVIQTRRSSQSRGTDYAVIDRRYDAGGQEPSFESLPYFSAGAAFTPLAAAQPGVRRYHDGLSRVTRIVFPDGREARLDYAPWQIVVTDPEDADAASPHAGTPITYSFDFGRRAVEVSTTIRNGNGPGTAVATTRYGYDAADRLVRITDAEGTVTSFSLDARGDVQRLRHPDAGDTVRLFDAHRRRIYERNAVGDEWCFAFDALGRWTDDVPGADPTQAAAVVRRYDGAGPGTSVGQLVRAEVVPDSVVTQYTYDRRGHVANVTRTIGGVVVASDTMTYDDLGEVSRHAFTGGAALEWTRGIDGLLSRVRFIQADGTIVPMTDGIVYDAAGRVSGATICGGTLRYSSSFEASTARMASRAYLDGAGAPLYRLTNFVYDGVGNLRSYDEEAPPAGRVSWALVHDSLYRLRGATATRGAAAIADLEYRHNLASNVTRSDETAPGLTLAYDPARPDLVTGVVGGATLYTHDAAGRLRSTPALTNVRWSARDRVAQMTDGGARQLDVVYDHNRELLAVDSTTGGVTERSYFFSAVHERHAGVDRYIALLDGLQCVAARDDGTRVVLARGMAGSVTRTMDHAGAVIAGSTELYAPFGAAIAAASTPWPRGYAGAVRGLDGMYLMGARPYVAGLGRFGAPDAVLFDPLPDELPFEPRRVNPYAYALVNPHTFIDPDGRLALIDDIIFYGIGRATGLRNDSFFEGVAQNFVESWSVMLRTIVPFHSGTTPAQVAAWPVQLAWGGVNLVIGNLVAYGAVELFGAKTEMREHVQLIEIPHRGFGAFTLGNKVIGDPKTLKNYWQHEQGHYFQNLALGPMYMLVIGLPSLIHAGLHPIIHPGQPYEDFYTETWADAWGK